MNPATIYVVFAKGDSKIQRRQIILAAEEVFSTVALKVLPYVEG